MKFFFDMSALVKFFYVECGTEIVTQIMEHTGAEIWISDLARLEFPVRFTGVIAINRLMKLNCT